MEEKIKIQFAIRKHILKTDPYEYWDGERFGLLFSKARLYNTEREANTIVESYFSVQPGITVIKTYTNPNQKKPVVEKIKRF